MLTCPREAASGRRRYRAQAVAAALAVFVTAGCEIRDEHVRAAGSARLWPAARTADDAGGADAQFRDVEFVEGYEAAARRAAAEGRPLLLVFGASWCRWSGELARGPLADRDVVARSRRFVCVFVDADRDAATCRTFGVTAFPTVLVLDSGGGERFRATGAGAGGSLAAALDAVTDRDGGPRRIAGETKDVTR